MAGNDATIVVGGEELADNDEGWVDEVESLNEEESLELETTILPLKDLGLRKFELGDHEWVIIEQLHNVLKILKDATLYFSHSTPNLATVIPVMDHIDKHLTTLGHDKNLTDNSEVYRIAMILYPQHKLVYFKAACWQDNWIETAKKLGHDEADPNAGRHHKLTNIFNDLPALAPPKETDLGSEIDCYLSAMDSLC
ncbi:hypothetical protein BU17DRAFT_80950 [Hysterangium stoloniferum]|nr:hypothetical protein BU17DRAFT_80950 [Hysterangium stoloniferum]